MLPLWTAEEIHSYEKFCLLLLLLLLLSWLAVCQALYLCPAEDSTTRRVEGATPDRLWPCGAEPAAPGRQRLPPAGHPPWWGCSGDPAAPRSPRWAPRWPPAWPRRSPARCRCRSRSRRLGSEWSGSAGRCPPRLPDPRPARRTRRCRGRCKRGAAWWVPRSAPAAPQPRRADLHTPPASAALLTHSSAWLTRRRRRWGSLGAAPTPAARGGPCQRPASCGPRENTRSARCHRHHRPETARYQLSSAPPCPPARTSRGPQAWAAVRGSPPES